MILWKLVLKKTRPHWKTHFENSSLRKTHFEKLPLCKTYLENSSENFLTEFFGKTMISAEISWPLSLPWMKWQSQADIAGNQPISLTIFILLSSLLKWDCLPHNHSALCSSPDPSVCLLRARLWLKINRCQNSDGTHARTPNITKSTGKSSWRSVITMKTRS